MEKLCQECGKAIKGRSDKKFCSMICRNAYHNGENARFYKKLSRINNILRRNYLILSKLNPSGKTMVSQHQLTLAGFNFDYFTHLYTNTKGDCYRFCYEHGYLKISRQGYLLVRGNVSKHNNEIILKSEQKVT